IDRIRPHLEAILAGRGTEHDWNVLVEAVDEMVAEGLPPSNKVIRDLLMPVLDDLPDRDDLPPGLRLVLREIDRTLATVANGGEAVVAHEPTDEVKEAARLLSGRTVVLIGGVRRP